MQSSDPATLRPNQDNAAAAINRALEAAQRSRGPKYLLLSGAIFGLVTSGYLVAGQKLPSDEQLVRATGFSLGTVHAAMKALVQDQVVERRHGSGTFIRDPSIDMTDVWHFRFRDGVAGLLPVKARALSCTVETCSDSWTHNFPNASNYIHVLRDIQVNDEFSLASEFYFDENRFGDMIGEPLASFSRVVLRNYIFDRYGIRARLRKQLLDLARVEPQHAVTIGVNPGDTAMRLEILGEDASGETIYFHRVMIPQNPYKLVLSEGG
ncbi:GntR family transcriptional regulator [Marivita sp.]|uniref:GntR family transcriptional regulator n=1 Tax=Marivita sp. TaxID=2003365 RepID=UPI0025C6A0BB|nr:GntR family transcriptional regulator [Marivita sp.]